jgi:ABC-type glutathione transport system ATPase component
LSVAGVQPAVSVRALRKVFPGRGGGPDVVAIEGATFDVAPGTTLGIIGESGSGKSTLARCMLGLIRADSGQVDILGTPIIGSDERALRPLRAQAQIVFQEPFESLDPRVRIGAAVAEPLRIHTALRGDELHARVAQLLTQVTLDPELASRFPHELSGGQQQRVNIARAVATRPRLVVLDEPTSSLDVSVRADVLRLLRRLQRELGLTYVLISHDLPTIRAMCDEVVVMFRGTIVEHGPAASVMEHPDHPYTRYLLASDLPLDPAADPLPLPARWDLDPPATVVAVPPSKMPDSPGRNLQ